MTTAIVDRLVDPMVLQIRDCLCHELTRTRMGPVCRCYYTHSSPPPVDDGCHCDCDVTVNGIPQSGNGDGRVRIVTMTPDFTGQTGPAPQACPPGWIVTLELSTSRCIPTSDGPEPLEDTELTDTALQLGDDRAALIRVLGCCSALTDRDVMVETMQPVGPQGGCAGWALSLQVAIPGGPGGC